MPNIEYELNERIHAIIINPYLTWGDFRVNCDLIKKYNIKNISTSLNYLSDFKNLLDNLIKFGIYSMPFAPLSFAKLTNSSINETGKSAKG